MEARGRPSRAAPGTLGPVPGSRRTVEIPYPDPALPDPEPPAPEPEPPDPNPKPI
jgi:hypothetical protein